MARKNKKEVIDNLKIESIGFNGVSIARKDSKVYFVKGGVPGDEVLARQFRKRKSYVESTILEITKESENRIEAPCQYFGICGGCSWQNMPYQYQLDWKKTHVEDAFVRQNKLTDIQISDVLPSPKVFNYRNKMEFSFASSRWLTTDEIQADEEASHKNFALGLHIPGRFDKVLDLHNCLISDDQSEFILNKFRDIALELDISAFDRRKNIGFLRNLIIRTGDDGNSLLAILITNTVSETKQESYISRISDELSKNEKITGFIHAINSGPNPKNIDSTNLLFGIEFIYQKILDINYKISPFSFFQTNSYQLDNFIREIISIADIKSDDVVWDLYCGTGSITFPASKNCKKVIGIELIESSIKDAKTNSEINNIQNVEFYAEDLHKKDIPDLLNNLDSPDIIILDPPRSGLHKNLIQHLINIKCKRIVYVSCNPMTQARDCSELKDFYKIEKMQPVDMFPHTYHIENIALMTLKA